MRWSKLITFILSACASIGGVSASEEDLTSMSLEQLMNEPVTSVSKKETKLSESPAAISVLTQEDIRRSGLTSLAEVLRLVPGLDVARISSSEWAVSARGFNNEFAGKLLVLIDGRTVYTPSTGGVLWNVQDVMTEDIDRIEVIRGPGATLWGANAVNGVINIISKRAEDTHGVLVAASEGSEEHPLLAARYGSQAGAALSYRVYAKYFDRDGFRDPTDTVDTGGWRTFRSGFRTDWNGAPKDRVTVQGDMYTGQADGQVSVVSLTPPSAITANSVEHNSGANVLGRWTRTFSAESDLTLQAYFDHVIQGNGWDYEHRNTYDISLQHRFGWGSVNDVLWGAGYRLTSIEETKSFDITFNPSRLDLRLFNFFLQDEITVIPNRLHVTLGSKFEGNNIGAGKSVEPNLRVAWTPTNSQTAWAAISRAIRTPATFELDGRLNLTALPGVMGPPVLISLLPNAQLESEKLVAYEVGYRIAPSKNISLDIAGFINRYSDLIFVENLAPYIESNPPPVHLLIASQQENADKAQSHGVEVSAQWQVRKEWMLTASYSWLHIDIPEDPEAALTSPKQQFQIRSSLDLPHQLQFSTAFYYVDAITDSSGPLLVSIPSYVRVDAGLLWRPDNRWSVGIWGQNLQSQRHMEFASLQRLSEIPRSILGKVTWSH